MILVTGDTHIPIDVSKLNMKNFIHQKYLNRDDYLVILGDFGGIWFGDKKDKWWLDWFQRKNFTTLIIDGNHENFNLLNSYPIEIWNGGKVHKIRDNVFHLMRGQVFEIDGNKIFTMGGASSIDKMFRKKDISYWEEELPSQEELAEALDNLEKYNFEVDYIFTHTCSRRVKYQMGYYDTDILNSFFDYLEDALKYKHWYFGHFHRDKNFDKNKTCVYNQIKLIKKY